MNKTNNLRTPSEVTAHLLLPMRLLDNLTLKDEVCLRPTRRKYDMQHLVVTSSRSCHVVCRLLSCF